MGAWSLSQSFTWVGHGFWAYLHICMPQGTNYQLLMSVYCTDRSSGYRFDGNLAWVTLLANVTVPLEGEPEVCV